jgi:hypothetical protein
LFDLDSLGKDNYGKPASTSVTSPTRPAGTTGNMGGNFGTGYGGNGMNMNMNMGMGMGANQGTSIVTTPSHFSNLL